MLHNVKVSLVVYLPMKPSCYVIILGHKEKVTEKKSSSSKKNHKAIRIFIEVSFFSLCNSFPLFMCVCLCTCVHAHAPPHTQSTDRHSGSQPVTITSSIAINSFMNIHVSAHVTILQHRLPEVKILYQHLSDMHSKLYQIVQNCLRKQFALSLAVKETIFTFTLTWCY